MQIAFNYEVGLFIYWWRTVSGSLRWSNRSLAGGGSDWVVRETDLDLFVFGSLPTESITL